MLGEFLNVVDMGVNLGDSFKVSSSVMPYQPIYNTYKEGFKGKKNKLVIN